MTTALALSALLQEYAKNLNVDVTFVTIGFLLLAVWSLMWKGIALWIAARNHQKRWFIVMIIINSTFGILEIIYLVWFRRDKRPGVTPSLFNNPVPSKKEAPEAI